MGKDLGAAPNEYRLLNRRSATQGSWGIMELRERRWCKPDWVSDERRRCMLYPGSLVCFISCS